MIVLGIWAFENWLGHEVRALMSVVNAFTKETPERSFAPSHEAHSSTKMPGLNQEEGPDGTMLTPWSCTFRLSEL